MNVLLIGSTGAGKTTYARQLAREHGALVFSIDEWMQNLFAPDLAGSGFDAIVERTRRVRRQMWAVAQQALARGVPVIFDSGLLTFADRASERAAARVLGVSQHSHYLATPAELRWKRVSARNDLRDGGYMFDVSRPMFDFIERIWQAPDDDEIAEENFAVIVVGDP